VQRPSAAGIATCNIGTEAASIGRDRQADRERDHDGEPDQEALRHGDIGISLYMLRQTDGRGKIFRLRAEHARMLISVHRLATTLGSGFPVVACRECNVT
jgi:hypothetical protein